MSEIYIETSPSKIILKDYFKPINPNKTDPKVEQYCKAMGMTLDEILPPKNTWDMKELEIPYSRLM